MSAMKIMDNIHCRVGEVQRFASICGGLPAPAKAANNALLYMFSCWSPMGMIRASQNDLTYRRDRVEITVNGANLLASAKQSMHGNLSIFLECLPNQNSLIYDKKYGIQ
jgi:alpha-aminoadipic semialdehyde synthase